MTAEEKSAIKEYLENGFGEIGETVNGLIDRMRGWGLMDNLPSHVIEILYTRIALEHKEVYNIMGTPCREDLLIKPASQNIDRFIVKPIQRYARQNKVSFNVDYLKIDLSLYLFTLIMFERDGKREQLSSAGSNIILVAFEVIHEICKREYPNLVKFNLTYYSVLSAIILTNIIEELGE